MQRPREIRHGERLHFRPTAPLSSSCADCAAAAATTAHSNLKFASQLQLDCLNVTYPLRKPHTESIIPSPHEQSS